jgi:hemerythrin-like domain-containing protein
MAEIIDSLREDHRNMHRLLDVLDSQIEVFRRGEEPDYELLTQTIDYCLNYPDHIHHPMEDEVYRHLSAKDPALKKQMGDLEAAHDDLSALTRRVAQALEAILKEGEVDRQAVVGVTEAFIRAYRRHIEIEERSFFPLAERALDADDWKSIEAGLAQSTDPLFGEDTAAAYRRLRDNIIRWSGGTATS